MTLAGSSGQQATLVEGVKEVLRNDGEAVRWLRNWYRESEVLKNQKVYLAEHHIYGSSRIGMQKYLPEEVRYQYGVNAGGSVTVDNLTGTRPWYTRYGNDLFSSTLYNNTLSVANQSSSGMGVNVHILGNRHYELTNHLGNVQATVLDRVTPIVEGTAPVQGYKADISNAWDYHPFGMYMPGRYVSDTSRKCITMNTTVLVPTVTKVLVGPAIGPDIYVVPWQWGHPGTPQAWQLVKKASFDKEPLHIFHFLSAAEHEGGVIATVQPQGNGNAYSINLGNEPPGVTAFLQLHADAGETEQQVGFTMPASADIRTEVRVRQYMGNIDQYEEAVPWTNVNSGEQVVTVPMNSTAIAAGGKTLLELRFTTYNGAHFNQNATAQVFSLWKYVTTYTSENRIATICDGQEDYRFGFNGQEKDNEIKGIGNSLDFGARIYDSRLGRFLSTDPLGSKNPMFSPYSFAANSPIYLIDKDGEEPTIAAYKKAAERLGVPVAAIRSVYITETGGKAYYADGRLKILFERHYFHNATNGRFDKSNPDLSNARRGGYGKYSQQHPKFEMAKALDENAAYHSTSFSGFQIMGANYFSAGEFKSAKEFGESMLKGSEDVHLDAFVNYVNNNSSLKNSLQKRDWKKFAEGYNGPSYKDNNYDTKMSDNYEKLKDDPYKGYDGESNQNSSSEKKPSNIHVSFDSSIEGYQK